MQNDVASQPVACLELEFGLYTTDHAQGNMLLCWYRQMISIRLLELR